MSTMPVGGLIPRATDDAADLVVRDSSPAGGPAPGPGRRVPSVLVMSLGALAGALLLGHAEPLPVLGPVLLLLTAASSAARRLSVRAPAWTGPTA
ncbi:hypothetical protein [Streptomyces sp. NRRL S-340]|uniref:hypothetical protein n=1 Tax=Streptomyces sp. NRRL S-340 TaxID=1463901 RepID=UPI0022771E3A|nr:hypothetical protein [Streptomyces sp. NRRL S-340]